MKSEIRPLVVLRIVCLLVLMPLIALSGCSSIKVKLGWRLSLAKTPVKSMEISLNGDPGMAPGEKTAMIVDLTGADDKPLVTEGAGKGKVMWKDLAVTASVVSADKKGNLTLPRDPRVSDGKTGHVTIMVPSQPGVSADLDIPLRYDYPFRAGFAGSSGMNGSSGNNGLNGSDGSMGSMDPDNPSAGGNGTDGTNGTDGSNGGDGGDGPPVQVWVRLRPGSHPLLQVGVLAKGHRERFYLVDPQGGSLTVIDTGGAGGSGGKGGSGGRGGSGGIGMPPGMSGQDGMNGHDGSDGSAGSGGSISVTYDTSAAAYLSCIHLSNPGGPQPTFQEEPVPPLW